ncbi:BTAD domain-containing putative transcriptional regulator [Catellatospora paridis]|uniref:BTAD domain-containing putative transcriptional regulator n=1 Tax=Catellatospora paridis TaxID=1617086 RepID=UPI001E467EEC|nr:BTAD domain-containing putative transcriptional regulator [Catellatospora paridis]
MARLTTSSTRGKVNHSGGAERPTGMEFRLLGPFEACHDGRLVEIASRRQERCLLALLLLDLGHLVTIDRLINLLWNGSAPASARGAVYTYVGRLRAALSPYGVRITTRADGYLVEADDHRVDVTDFHRTVQQGLDAADPAARAALLDGALRLWRGPLLADVADEALRHRLDGQLDEARLVAVETRAEAHLDLGRHARVVKDLAELAEVFPLRERLVGILMTAHYRAARQADALLLYEATRKALATELGVDPGPDLQELHRRILRNDARLDQPRRAVYEVRVREEMLPWTVGGHPALDFCNTFAGWGLPSPAPPSAEWLRGYSTFAVWSGYIGLADDPTVSRLLTLAGRDPAEADRTLEQARTLRAQVYACLNGHADHAAFDAVARAAEAAAKTLEYTRDETGGGRWRPGLDAGLRLPLHAAAWSAAELLADPRRLTVRSCAESHCRWLFMDETSMRRWCSLVTCAA